MHIAYLVQKPNCGHAGGCDHKHFAWLCVDLKKSTQGEQIALRSRHRVTNVLSASLTSARKTYVCARSNFINPYFSQYTNGHIILTPANQLMVMGLKIWSVSSQSGFDQPATFRSLTHELTNCSNQAHSKYKTTWWQERVQGTGYCLESFESCESRWFLADELVRNGLMWVDRKTCTTWKHTPLPW
jgi:hypothetical protein